MKAWVLNTPAPVNERPLTVSEIPLPTPLEDELLLRVNACGIVYRIDEDRIMILDVFKKTTRQTPDAVIKRCRRRLGEYDLARRVQ